MSNVQVYSGKDFDVVDRAGQVSLKHSERYPHTRTRDDAKTSASQPLPEEEADKDAVTSPGWIAATVLLRGAVAAASAWALWKLYKRLKSR